MRYVLFQYQTKPTNYLPTNSNQQGLSQQQRVLSVYTFCWAQSTEQPATKAGAFALPCYFNASIKVWLSPSSFMLFFNILMYFILYKILFNFPSLVPLLSCSPYSWTWVCVAFALGRHVESMDGNGKQACHACLRAWRGAPNAVLSYAYSSTEEGLHHTHSLTYTIIIRQTKKIQKYQLLTYKFTKYKCCAKNLVVPRGDANVMLYSDSMKLDIDNQFRRKLCRFVQIQV